MFDDLKAHVKNWEDEAELEEYLTGLLDKKGFDHSGLIYGMGHAVYTNSDPRARILKGYAERLAKEKGRTKEFELYRSVEQISGRLLAARRRSGKPISANVDFTVDLCTVCLGYLSSCSHLYLQLHV